MKKRFFLTAALVVAALSLMTSCSTYNGMVAKKVATEEAWGNVEAAYQRRADLIPNLVATVKGYATHEKETLEGIVEARASATKPTIDPANITQENLAQYQKAQSEISGTIGRLLAIAENYPDLKASEQFTQLQDELAGTENRINVARRDFNATVRDYNTEIQSFPQLIIAKMFGFDSKVMFEAEEGAEKAPKVEF